jgi:hypothetical protein
MTGLRGWESDDAGLVIGVKYALVSACARGDVGRSHSADSDFGQHQSAGIVEQRRFIALTFQCAQS